MKWLPPLWRAGLALILACSVVLPLRAEYVNPVWASANPVDPTSPEWQAAAQTLTNLTPAEKVGQLFLVTFEGSQTDQDSQIHSLITDYHVGGVMLRADHDNFPPSESIVSQTHDLISRLQQAEWDDAQLQDPEQAGAADHYVPLFIGIEQEGDGSPYDQLLSGLSPLPNQMAIGATWQPELAERVGSVLGGELSALGVNLLLGPSLDVINPNQYQSSGLGTHSFGGDHYWVQEMGKAYIAGLHSGSQGRLAVIARHFPGQGSSDRTPNYEVATVRKDLEQLRQVDLVPFLGVANLALPPEYLADGLLVSHIRYLFQGNVRQATRPVSLDANALNELMQLPELQPWHDSRGILVSDDLGSRSVRRFYDPAGATFSARQVALDAFQAGNDLLYVNNFVADTDPDAYTTITRTLEHFTRKYTEDALFAQRVDQSVMRILMVKQRMYGQFAISSVLPSGNDLSGLGSSPAAMQASLEVARNAVTLISPNQAELPDVPVLRERMVFITDSRLVSQCSTCGNQVEMPVDSLQSAILRLYGPQGGGLVSQSRMSSYSFRDLLDLLDDQPAPDEGEPPLQTDLNRADWIVFSMLDANPNVPVSLALHRFLAERPELARNKKVVVFAFEAPYYLDATEISKLSAYYALYGKTPAFVEVAARVLFQELPVGGFAPVSIPGAGYDLYNMLTPNPNQIIPLMLDLPVLDPNPNATSEPTPVPAFRVGDTLPLVAGQLLDHNGNVVPDGTPVTFIFTIDGGASGMQQVVANTINGLAHATYQIDQEGLLEVRVESDPAKNSAILRLNNLSGERATVVAITPTLQATETPTPSPTPEPTITPTATVPPPPPDSPGDFTDWLLSMALILTGAGGILGLGIWWGSLRWAVRWALCGIVGGLMAYLILSVSLPAGLNQTPLLGGTMGGVILGGLAGVAWRSWADQRFLRRSPRT